MIVDPVAAWLASVAEDAAPELHREFTERQCCAAAEAAGQKFCPQCGSPVNQAPQEWVCRSGHANDAGHLFCPSCGDQRPELRAPVVGAGAVVELAARPKPYEELTPAERAERERQHVAAVSMGSRDPGVSFEPPRTGETVLIHFLEDGLSFAGTVWFRGQELELDVGSQRWQEAQAWINMTDFEQMQRYEKVMYRKGPWPGLRYVDALQGGQGRGLGPLRDGGDEVKGPDVKQLLEAESRERRRNRGVPRPVIG